MIKKNSLYFLLCILLPLTALGSIFDKEISDALYLGESTDNMFGIIFSYIGIIPVFLGWSFLGVSIITISQKTNLGKIKNSLLMVLAVLAFLLSLFFFCNTVFLVNKHAFSVHWCIAYFGGASIVLISGYCGYYFSKRSSNPELLKKAVLLTLVGITLMIVIMITKNIMDRPRYRFIMDLQNADIYKNWWQNGNSLKMSFGDNRFKDEFSSFPSGHSAYAMFAIFFFPLMSEYKTNSKSQQSLLFLFGIIWWGFTAYSRIMVGAHFLTDVCIGGIITIVIYLFFDYLIPDK